MLFKLVQSYRFFKGYAVLNRFCNIIDIVIYTL